MARAATVEVPTGALSVTWDEAGGHVTLTGPTNRVFTGAFDAAALRAPANR